MKDGQVVALGRRGIIIAMLLVAGFDQFIIPESEEHGEIAELGDTIEVAHVLGRTQEITRMTTVDSTGNVGKHTSLAVDSGGDVHVSYRDVTNADLKYATYDGVSWTNITVDSSGSVGQYASLAVDSSGDNADPDDDNDGWSDLTEGSCLTDSRNNASIPLDSDGDGTCDALEDDDNDGFDNTMEILCGSDPSDNLSLPEDLDSDGICDPEDEDIDGDSWSDVGESECGTDPRNNASAPVDTDGDGDCDAIDGDDDNDGVIDEDDRFPFNGSEWSDMDGDGIGDNAYPDDDNDGTPDDADVFPFDPCAAQDTDGDGESDTIERDCTTSLKEDFDDDGDGVDDLEDLFPLNRAEWADDDGDGIGNNEDINDDRITETPDVVVNETNESVDPGVPFLYNATALSKHQTHAEGLSFGGHFWILRDLQVEPGMKIIVNGHISTIMVVNPEDGVDYISQTSELQYVEIDQEHPVPFYHGDTIEFYGYVTEVIPEQPQTSVISLDLEFRDWGAVAGGSGVLGTILAVALKARKAVRGDDEERMEKKLKEKKSSIPMGWSKEQYEKYGKYGNFSASMNDDER